MKRILAISLALIMALSFAACKDGGQQSPSADSPPPGGESPAPSGPAETGGASGDGGEGSAPVGGESGYTDIGFFDPNYDYSRHKMFKIAFLSNSNDFLTLEFDAAYKDWAARMNINYTGLWASTSGNNDEYLSGLQLYCDQDYDGLLLQPDLSIYGRIAEILEEAGMPWISGIGQARADNGAGALLHPSVGFSDLDVGYKLMQYCLDWKDANYPDVQWDKVGVIAIDMGVSVEIMRRTYGTELRWVQTRPEMGAADESREVNPKNFWICDTAMGTFDQVTAQNMTTQVVTANPGIEVWLVPAAVDFYAMGAAQAFENLGFTDKSVIVCNGGSQLPLQLDSGKETAWRSALFTPQTMYAEPMIAQLWAFMAELATPETIYPEWVKWDDKGDVFDGSGNLVEEHSYAQVLIPSFWIDKDNYKSYLEWTDLYGYGAGVEGHYSYEPVSDLSLYSARETVPAEYAGS
jgi:ABC-type sugar transport system substrate-binding protein